MWIFKEHLQKLISHQKELHCPLLQKDTITKQFLYIEHVYIRLTEFWKKCSDCFNNGCMARLCANLKNDGEKI